MKKPKRELVLASLVNDTREVMNLLAVGREDKTGQFPNAETNFLVRKLRMIESKKRNWRGAQIFEITIPRACANKLMKAMHRLLEQTSAQQPGELREEDFRDPHEGVVVTSPARESRKPPTFETAT